MNATTSALAAQRLARAALARQLFIGQRDDLQRDTVTTIDHQLIERVATLQDEYLQAGGTEAQAREILKDAERRAEAQLDA